MTDAIAIACNVVLMIAMLPMLIGDDKPPLLSSVPTAAALTGLAAVWALLGQVGATVTCGLMAALWWSTVAQVAYRKRLQKRTL